VCFFDAGSRPPALSRRYAADALRERSLLRARDVKVLEASLHPSPSVVIAHIHFEPNRVTVSPVQSALDDTAPMAELRALVAHAGSDPYRWLMDLQSEHWSFAPARVVMS
jgi:hypothetical protein